MPKRHFVTALISLAMLMASAGAQASKSGSLSSYSTAGANSGPNKVKTTPLTPKSAISTGHKSAANLPASNSAHKTSMDLDRIERENVKSTGMGKTASSTPKTQRVKPVQTSRNTNSGINASYQKPKAVR